MSRSTRRTAALALVALVAPLAPVLALTAQAQADPNAAVAVLADAPAGTPTPAVIPGYSERARAAELALDLDDLEVGRRLEFDLFDDVGVTGTVTGREEVAGTPVWSGVLPSAGSFRVTRSGEQTLISVEGEEGTFAVTATGRRAQVVEHDLSAPDTEARPPAAGPSVKPERNGIRRSLRVPEEAVEETPGRQARGTADAAGAPASVAPGEDGAVLETFGPGATVTGNPGDAVPLGDALSTPSADSASSIKLLVVYSNQAVNRANALAGGGSGAGNLVNRLNTMIAETKAAFATSKIPTTVDVVPTLVNLGNQNAGATSVQAQLTSIRTRDGFQDQVFDLRDQYKADTVAWVVDATAPGGDCGVGYLPVAGPDYSFNATDIDCFYKYTATHEYGHNLGADHEVGNASTASALYARGTTGSGWRTIMSYGSACGANPDGTCPRKAFFSNPAVTYGGVPTGSAYADNARAITENLQTVANWRPETIVPGQSGWSGSRMWGSTGITLASGGWLPQHTALSVQWYLNGAPIAGATAPTFVPQAWMTGQSLNAVITGNANRYAPVSITSPTTVVLGQRMTTAMTTLSGKRRPGGKLRIKLGPYLPPGASATVSWTRKAKHRKARTKVTRKRVYKVKRGDRGKTFTVRIAISHPQYQTSYLRWKKFRIR